jgi:hypothetical protein
MRPRALTALLLSCAFGACSEAHAQPASVSVDSAEPVRITEVGHSGEWRALEQLLQEFLRPHHISPAFETQGAFYPGDATRDAVSSGARVWIELVSAERARLVLSDAKRGRYLLREVPLTNGLDEVGRETLCQVIESALMALRSHDKALTRDELAELLTKPTLAPAERPHTTNAAAAGAGSLERRAPPKGGVTLEPNTAPSLPSSFRLSLAYLAQWTGSELGLLHGPGLRLEWATRPRAGFLVGGALTGEMHFGQSYSGPLVGVNVRSNSGWLTLVVKRSWSDGTSLGVGAGAGVERSKIVPRAVSGGLRDIAASSSDTTLWLRAELGYERQFAAWSVALGLVTDIFTHDTHYDVSRAGQTERLFAPWAVRPGLRAALGWGN